MEKLRTGIIGCGKVGDFHAKVYAELPQSEFVAVCDADSARAEAFASRYGVKAYTDVATMCRDARLDVVSICTPVSYTHLCPTLLHQINNYKTAG